MAAAKKLRARVAADVIAAAYAVEADSIAAACPLLRQAADALHRSVPLKQYQRVEQAVTRAIVAAKRAAGEQREARGCDGAESPVLALSEEAVLCIARHLSAPDLAAFCCTCRCAHAECALRNVSTLLRRHSARRRHYHTGKAVLQTRSGRPCSCHACVSRIGKQPLGGASTRSLLQVRRWPCALRYRALGRPSPSLYYS